MLYWLCINLEGYACMKKLLCFVLCALLLAIPAMSYAYTASFSGSKLFDFSYDSTAYRMDQESYLSSNRGNRGWFFLLYNDSCTIDCGMFTDEATQAMSNGDAAALSAHIADRYARFQPVSQGVCTVNGLGYALFSLSSPSTGDSYLAATVINGCAVTFEIYSPVSAPLDTAALSTLKNVLSGCTPLE